MGGIFSNVCNAVEGAFPVFGKHACHITGAYAITAIVLAVLVIATLRGNARARRNLDRLEEGRRRRNG